MMLKQMVKITHHIILKVPFVFCNPYNDFCGLLSMSLAMRGLTQQFAINCMRRQSILLHNVI